MRLRRAVLRGIRVADPDCRKRLYLFLCDAWRADCVDYRVGPDPRIRIWRGDRGGRVERPPASAPPRPREGNAPPTPLHFSNHLPARAIIKSTTPVSPPHQP